MRAFVLLCVVGCLAPRTSVKDLEQRDSGSVDITVESGFCECYDKIALFTCPDDCWMATDFELMLGDSSARYPDATGITTTLYLGGSPIPSDYTDGTNGSLHADWSVRGTYDRSMVDKIVLSDASGEWTIY
jgi:hypothetical protein